MTGSPETAELLAAEVELQQAVLASDVDALDRLLHDDVRYTGPDGRTLDKATDLETYRSGTLDVTGFDVEEVEATVIGELGLTFLLARLTGRIGEQQFDVRFRWTRTWTRHAGHWQAIAAHASLIT